MGMPGTRAGIARELRLQAARLKKLADKTENDYITDLQLALDYSSEIGTLRTYVTEIAKGNQWEDDFKK